jgi:fibronectin type 3 domain-containing protein
MNSKKHLFVVGGIISVFGMIHLSCGSALEDGTLPAPARVIAMATAYNSVRVTWEAVKDASYYDIYRAKADEDGIEGSYSVVATDQTALTYNNTALDYDTTYFYKIKAWSSGHAMSSGLSPVDFAKTPFPPSLGAPGGIATKSIISKPEIALSWNAVTGVKSYCLYRGTTSSDVTELIWTGTTETTINSSGATVSTLPPTSYVVGDLAEGTTYYFALSTINAAGVEGAKSAVVAAETYSSSGNSLPAPTDVTAIATAYNSIRITWNAVEGAYYYDVYRTTNEKDGYSVIASNLTALTYNNTGLVAETTYYYKVLARSVNSLRQSALSEAVADYVTTPEAPAAAVLGAPGGIIAKVISDTEIRLQWNVVANAAGYNIYIYEGKSAGTNNANVTELLDTVTGSPLPNSYSVKDLLSETIYYFAIRTLNADNVEGAKSTAAVSGTTMATPEEGAP